MAETAIQWYSMNFAYNTQGGSRLEILESASGVGFPPAIQVVSDMINGIGFILADGLMVRFNLPLLMCH